MSTENATALIVEAQALLDQALGELAPPPTTPVITTEDEFDDAYAAAASGDTLVLSSSFRYSKEVTLDKAITLKSQTLYRRGRIGGEELLPLFTNGTRVTGNNIAARGIGFLHTAVDTDIVVLLGEHLTFDRVRVLGHPAHGAKRGIAANGSAMIVDGSYIDYCFQLGMDTQAICSWDMGGGLTVSNTYLGGAGQSLMLGGADSSSPERMPHDVFVLNCQFGKNPAWQEIGAQVKTSLEIKAVRRMVVDGCVLEYAGTAQGQGAYLIVCTVRNQDGRAEWSCIEDVTVQNCTGGHASGICNILGSDNVNPSGTLDRLMLRDCSFVDIDPYNTTAGHGRLFTFDRAPRHVTIHNIHVQGANLNQWGYFSGEPPVAMVLTQLADLPPSEYGWYVDAKGSGRTVLQAYAPDAILDETIV